MAVKYNTKGRTSTCEFRDRGVLHGFGFPVGRMLLGETPTK